MASKHNVQECICVGCENMRNDAKRYRHLRDHTGNKLMRKLMQLCHGDSWDEAVDADMKTSHETSGEQPK